jgi:hypothetical protein
MKLAPMHQKDVDGLVANENSEVRRRALLNDAIMLWQVED